METVMKLALLAGGLALLLVPHAFADKLATWRTVHDEQAGYEHPSMAGPRLVGFACVLLALLSLLL
jgi:hypothetical protein